MCRYLGWAIGLSPLWGPIMRSSVCALVARKIGWFMRTRPARVSWAGGVASFTFDDFPKTALTVGGAILEKRGLRGTYYTALKLAGTENRLGPMFEPADVQAAHRSGHEIACHTHSHLDCRTAPTAAIESEIGENSRAIATLLDNHAPTSFAYPYGAVSIAAKRALATRFSTCRGTGEGVNHGAVDLADLLVLTLYDRVFDLAAVRRRIDEARATNGWLIVYTHDVADRPSEFGCKPEQFEAVVGYAAQRLTVLPVREVAARFAGGLAQGAAAA
jgi:peptidoglycan/xylan/chitin deacetylase (PgdA/CDA1 family)